MLVFISLLLYICQRLSPGYLSFLLLHRSFHLYLIHSHILSILVHAFRTLLLVSLSLETPSYSLMHGLE